MGDGADPEDAGDPHAAREPARSREDIVMITRNRGAVGMRTGS
jgi:hypothetical protein